MANLRSTFLLSASRFFEYSCKKPDNLLDLPTIARAFRAHAVLGRPRTCLFKCNKTSRCSFGSRNAGNRFLVFRPPQFLMVEISISFSNEAISHDFLTKRFTCFWEEYKSSADTRSFQPRALRSARLVETENNKHTTCHQKPRQDTHACEYASEEFLAFSSSRTSFHE